MGTQGIRVCARAAACLCLALSGKASASEGWSFGGEEAPIVTGRGFGGAVAAATDGSSSRLILEAADPAGLAEVLSPARPTGLAVAASWPAESLRVPLDRSPFSAFEPADPGALIARAELDFGREGSFGAMPAHLIAVEGAHSQDAVRLLVAAAIGLGVVMLVGSAALSLVWGKS